jgi:hypothetical protein
MLNYAGAFVGICIVRPCEFVYMHLIMLVPLLGRSGEFVYMRLIMLVHLLGRPGEFVYIRLIMLVYLLGYALLGLCWSNKNYRFMQTRPSGTKQVVVFPSKRQAKGNADGHQHTGTGPGGCIFYKSALFGQ